MSNQNQSTEVIDVLNQCVLHTKLQNFFGVGGIQNEPGLTIANNSNQMLLAKSMAWKFNRVECPFFVTQYGVQDYRFAGATLFIPISSVSSTNVPFGGASVDLASSPVNGGTAGITVSGGVVTVQTIDPHPFTSSNIGMTIYMSGNSNAAYNSTFSWDSLGQTSAWSGGFVITAVPDNLHLQFTASSAQIAVGSSGAPGITNWGWGESASVTNINSTAFPLPITPIDMVHRLAPTYTATGDKLAVCMLVDYGNGVLKFRLSQPSSSYPLQINTVYQARAPKLTDQSSVFAWPDNLKYVLIEVALFQAFRFATGISSQETAMQAQMAQSAIMQALESEDSEDSQDSMVPLQSFMK